MNCKTYQSFSDGLDKFIAPCREKDGDNQDLWTHLKYFSI